MGEHLPGPNALCRDLLGSEEERPPLGLPMRKLSLTEMRSFAQVTMATKWRREIQPHVALTVHTLPSHLQGHVMGEMMG